MTISLADITVGCAIIVMIIDTFLNIKYLIRHRKDWKIDHLGTMIWIFVAGCIISEVLSACLNVIVFPSHWSQYAKITDEQVYPIIQATYYDENALSDTAQHIEFTDSNENHYYLSTSGLFNINEDTAFKQQIKRSRIHRFKAYEQGESNTLRFWTETCEKQIGPVHLVADKWLSKQYYAVTFTEDVTSKIGDNGRVILLIEE